MMRNGRPRRPESAEHFVFGSPFDPDCPLCRDLESPPGGDLEEREGVLFLDLRSLEEARHCPCAVCAQFRAGGVF